MVHVPHQMAFLILGSSYHVDIYSNAHLSEVWQYKKGVWHPDWQLWQLQKGRVLHAALLSPNFTVQNLVPNDFARESLQLPGSLKGDSLASLT